MSGRPTKLTPELIDRLFLLWMDGCTDDAASRAVGVHPVTFARWKARARTARRGLLLILWQEYQGAKRIRDWERARSR